MVMASLLPSGAQDSTAMLAHEIKFGVHGYCPIECYKEN